MNCIMCDGDLAADPLSLGALASLSHHCSEHDAMVCPWCLSCQAVKPSETQQALAREKREAMLRIAQLIKDCGLDLHGPVE